MSKKIDVINVPVWWNRGNGHLLRRDCLGANHPEHPYNYVKREYPGVEPEEFGVYHPDHEYLKDKTREELLLECIQMKQFVRDMEDQMRALGI